MSDSQDDDGEYIFILSVHFFMPLEWYVEKYHGTSEGEMWEREMKNFPQRAHEMTQDFSRMRTVGVFKSLSEAEGVVKNNYGSIDENNYYNIAIIEKAPYGLFPSVYSKERWVYWMHSSGQGKEYLYSWGKIEEEFEYMREVVGYGIG